MAAPSRDLERTPGSTPERSAVRGLADAGSDRFTLAPGVPDLAALGADSPAALLGCGAEPATWGRAEVLPARAGVRRARLPLPGTPDASGRVHERPRGAGTGQVWLERFGPGTGWGELLRARFTAPPSASLAERHWNLYCDLRGAGIVTPEPMAVGARGRGPMARRSFLVLREPEAGLSLADWPLEVADAARRRLGLEALGAALGRLLASGTVLPELTPEVVLVAEEDSGGDCAAKELAAGARERGRVRRRLPEIVVTDVTGGRQAARWTARERRALLERLASRLLGEPRVQYEVRAGATGTRLTWRECARALLQTRALRATLATDWRALRSEAPGGKA